MKFSVLIPTRNRLKYLKYAVETVLRQDYADWELIISDNNSEEDIESYVRSLNDSRIRYFRTDRFVPVTDNWNNALDKSTGEYVLMLGDDDCLMKGYFSTIRHLADTYKNPDFIYTKAFLYAYPDVIPETPNGFLKLYDWAPFYDSSDKPLLLDKKQALALVHNSMRFKMVFTYNMQHSIIRREFIGSLQSKGKFFQSPYPDFYATNVIFLTAEHILIYPKPIIVIGISPKSFGYYYENNREKDGVEFLHNIPNTDDEIVQKLKNIILPGSNNFTSCLLSMETIKSNYGSEFCLRVSYQWYRFLQILHVFRGHFRGYSHNRNISKPEFYELWSHMYLWEKIAYGGSLFLLIFVIGKIFGNFPNRFIRKIGGMLKQSPRIESEIIGGKYNNILDVFEQVDPAKSLSQ